MKRTEGERERSRERRVEQIELIYCDEIEREKSNITLRRRKEVLANGQTEVDFPLNRIQLGG